MSVVPGWEGADRSETWGAVRKERERLEALLNGLPALLWETDASGEMLRHYAGALAAQLLPGESGLWLEMVFPEDREQAKAAAQQVLVHGRETRLELRCQTKDREPLWVQASLTAIKEDGGEAVGMRGVMLDITEKIREQTERTASEASLRGLFESNIVPLVYWHIDGRVLQANDAYLRLVGFTREELEAGELRWADLASPEQTAINRKLVERAAITRQPGTGENVYTLRDGRKVPVMIGGALLEGHPDQGVAFVLDVSERQRAEEAQRALVSGLIQAQEEERRTIAYELHDGLTQFVMASHAHLEAFRHAHNSGNMERASRELEMGLRYLRESVLESRRLVNGLCSLALDDLGLVGALEQLLAEERGPAGWEEAELTHNLSDRRLDTVLQTSVYRVAQEALTNARKHAASSRIRMTLHAEPLLQKERSTLTLEIRDWGCGFDPIGRPVDHSHLGLQSMKERVRLMEGTYELESAPGAGTTIRAVFPLLEAVEGEGQ